jgi:hypothetical protein
MNFIITYNISDSTKRTEFEKEIESKFPNSSKETTNQTTVVGDTNKTLNGTVKIIQEILNKITPSSNDTVTIYYPVLKNQIAEIEKKEILMPQTNEALTNEIQRMKYLSDYKSFQN